MPLEDHSIKAAQHGDNGSSELDGKWIGSLHGVLLRDGASASPF
jgi:hypothetical protein